MLKANQSRAVFFLQKKTHARFHPVFPRACNPEFKLGCGPHTLPESLSNPDVYTAKSDDAVGLLSPSHTPADTVEILCGANKDLPVGDGRGA
jgi:hypothetical protein